MLYSTNQRVHEGHCTALVNPAVCYQLEFFRPVHDERYVLERTSWCKGFQAKLVSLPLLVAITPVGTHYF